MTVMRWHRYFVPFKQLLPKPVWQRIRALATAILTPIRFSVRTGHWKSSMAMSARAASGKPIPWYTYPAIDFLAQRNFDGKNVLEFGGGQSTLWWSSVARSVLTVEEDADWHARLRTQIASNVSLHHVPRDRKNRTILPIKKLLDANPVQQFDIIVIDGHFRNLLTALAFDYLAPDGAIIFDNSEGYGFFEVTKDRDCRRVDFFGFAPGTPLRHCTSLVFVKDCFLLRPDIPIPIIEFVNR